jgi:hypothetical protein
VRINKLCTDFISNLLKIRKLRYTIYTILRYTIYLIQLCHKIVIYVVNLVYIAYMHVLIAIVLQWAFTNYWLPEKYGDLGRKE